VQALLEDWMKEVIAFTQSVEARVQALEDQIAKNIGCRISSIPSSMACAMRIIYGA